jgi:cell division protein FtsL
MRERKVSEQPATFPQQLNEFFRRNVNWFLACGLGLLLIQDVFGTHGVLAMRRAQREAASVQQEIDQINEENRQLQKNVQSLKTDPEAIERIAREEMGLARPGEYIFKIPARSDNPAVPSANPPAIPATKP